MKPKAAATKVVVAIKPVKPARPAKAVPAAKPEPQSKSVSKPVAKVATKSQPAAKVEKATKVKPVAKAATVSNPPVPPISKKKSESVSTNVTTESVAKSDKSAKPVDVAPALSPLGVPVRSGRPSSRLAQLTVPSMAQAVASTAAKASFTQMTTVQPIVSPLASAIKKDPKLANNWKTKAVADLTDAEVIAMSDDDYMNDTQLAFFRLRLVTLKNDILNSAGETTEHLREDTVVVPDPADRATIEEEHALELRTRDRERKLLKKIEQSINRIDAGDYGYCDETGEPIGVGRLLARPTATLSLEAQQRRELKQKMFGD
ncbi:RNA polymerase-binding protein DksA [Rhodoferax sp.]|uniref:RNA polymerase-binding protein DksA n=1 Tax=Rhodoferax sp. TaxID=50421 RepID=UPI00260A0A5B|nr:RNA polymerase-binding protein DksA [Rhodoferax sp.]